MSIETRPTGVLGAWTGDDRIRRGAIVAIVIAGTLLVWALLHGGESTPTRAKPQLATPATLRQLAAAVGHPVYWVGRLPEHKLELSRTRRGDIYIRYLSKEARLGDPRPDFLAVGTYEVKDAAKALRTLAKKQGGRIQSIKGADYLTSRENPRSVYMVPYGVDYQVEVFSPSPGAARVFVTAGKLKPAS